METFSLTFVIVLRCLDDHCQIIIYETKYQKLIEKETFLFKKKRKFQFNHIETMVTFIVVFQVPEVLDSKYIRPADSNRCISQVLAPLKKHT